MRKEIACFIPDKDFHNFPAIPLNFIALKNIYKKCVRFPQFLSYTLRANFLKIKKT